MTKIETTWTEIINYIEKLAECAKVKNYGGTLSSAFAITELLEKSNLKEMEQENPEEVE